MLFFWLLQCYCFVVAVHGYLWAWSQDAAGHVCGRAGSRGTGCGVRRKQAQVLPEVSERKVSPLDHQGLEQGTTRIHTHTHIHTFSHGSVVTEKPKWSSSCIATVLTPSTSPSTSIINLHIQNFAISSLDNTC